MFSLNEEWKMYSLSREHNFNNKIGIFHLLKLNKFILHFLISYSDDKEECQKSKKP